MLEKIFLVLSRNHILKSEVAMIGETKEFYIISLFPLTASGNYLILDKSLKRQNLTPSSIGKDIKTIYTANDLK